MKTLTDNRKEDSNMLYRMIVIFIIRNVHYSANSQTSVL